MPLTLFFQNDGEFQRFEPHTGHSSVLFMALSGNRDANKTVKVSTIKDVSWWEAATGEASDDMTAKAGALCSHETAVADVAALPAFMPQESVDYTEGAATLTACSLLDIKGNHEFLLGDATEHLYQLNHVYVTPPTLADNILFEDRLFTVLQCWDYSKRIQLGFRAKAMLALAGCSSAEEYLNNHKNGELRHPLLASIRVRVKRKLDSPSADSVLATEQSQGFSELFSQGAANVSTLVVEAIPISYAAASDVPNASVQAISGLLASGNGPTSERCVAAALEDLAPSPFYNMVFRGDPVDKALVLLQFTQRSKGAQMANGFRIVTDGAKDGSHATEHAADGSNATEHAAERKYRTIACCTVEKSPDFTAAKDAMALAVVCKVVKPSNEQHVAECYIECMETLARDEHAQAVAMIKELQRVATICAEPEQASGEAAWQQRKCRRLTRYPTMV